MKRILIVAGITALVIGVFAVFFAMQATPGNVLNAVRVQELENVNGTITVPEKYTVIEAQAFAGKADYSRVIIEGETEIGDSAFYGCPNLKEVIIEEKCDIGSKAFSDCPSLEKVTVRSAGGSCADDAFEGHGGLTIYGIDGSEVLDVAKLGDISFKTIP